MVQRINLTLDQELFDKLEESAEKNGITSVNLFILKTLEDIYYEQESFDYTEALETLIKETEALSDGEEFVLNDLPSFNEICVTTAEQGRLKPSAIRARLGKAFNQAIRKGNIPHVKRAKTEGRNGNEVLKFRSKLAVYVVDKGDSTTN